MNGMDLSYLMELGKMPGVEQMSSDLTPEQRKTAKKEINSICNRMSLWLHHRGMPREWLVVYGWPKLLEKVEEVSRSKSAESGLQ